ncbi:hypothetical protein ACO0LL_05690 [Undibacterium sp. TC4M20W]|uniref:hypothetical protein n=1 Tax=Undibacterium sp. TC4M20W TaxID=3413052 RepID=UPI003BF2C781
MASDILGRTSCPLNCGHDAAHVKIKNDKATGQAYPYVHCRGCGCQLHTKNDEQARHLLKITRKEKLDLPAPEIAQPVNEQPAQPVSVPEPIKTAQKPAFGLLPF